MTPLVVFKQTSADGRVLEAITIIPSHKQTADILCLWWFANSCLWEMVLHIRWRPYSLFFAYYECAQ
jgi:hypothetical protein